MHSCMLSSFPPHMHGSVTVHSHYEANFCVKDTHNRNIFPTLELAEFLEIRIVLSSEAHLESPCRTCLLMNRMVFFDTLCNAFCCITISKIVVAWNQVFGDPWLKPQSGRRQMCVVPAERESKKFEEDMQIRKLT